MSLSRLAALALLSVSLSACGFSPVYAPNSGIAQSLNNVSIEQVTGRVAQEVRNTLIEELTPNGTRSGTRYGLSIEIVEDLKPLAIRRDASVTRFDYQLTTRFSLRDSTTGQIVFSDTSEMTTSANRLDQSEFAGVIGVDDAKLRAARGTGQDIARRLSAYFARERDR